MGGSHESSVFGGLGQYLEVSLVFCSLVLPMHQRSPCLAGVRCWDPQHRAQISTDVREELQRKASHADRSLGNAQASSLLPWASLRIGDLGRNWMGEIRGVHMSLGIIYLGVGRIN